jgi:exopolysaccharide biosynthesis polyprenyl glycosylphosphotransferase
MSINLRRGAGAPTLIIGAGRVGHLIAARLLAKPQIGLRPVGFVDDDPFDVEEAAGVPVLGTTESVTELVRREEITHAILSFSTASHEVDLAISRQLRKLGVAISLVPRLFEDVPDWIELERVAGLPLLTSYPSRSHDWLLSAKYAMDRLMAAAALVVVAPVMAIAALATWLTVGSPVLFRQVRTGHDGKPFEILKFRTMRGDPLVDGEADTEWAAQIARGRTVESDDGADPRDVDDRTTRVGYTLRRYSIDELPQLFNVVRGQMSIVGPRPERETYVSQFEDAIHRYSERHRMKPGITGWAQVNGLRGPTSLDERVEWDNYYIENWSLWLDAKIMLMTFMAVVRGSE